MQASSSVGPGKGVAHAYLQVVLWRLHIPDLQGQAPGSVLHLSSLLPAEVNFQFDQRLELWKAQRSELKPIVTS